MKILCMFLIVLGFVYAQEIKVNADKFQANEIEQYGQFLGNVLVKKDKDILRADKLIVRLDKDKKPLKYIAQGNVRLEVFIDNKNYLGRGDTLVYIPQKKIYKIEGNAYLEDKSTHKKIYGNSISLDQNAGKYEVDSKKDMPVKFIFEIDDEKLGDKTDDPNN